MNIHDILKSCLLLVAFSSCKKDKEEAANPFIGITVNNEIKTQPDTISFSGSSTIPATFTWDFGDGSPTAAGETVSHIFDIGYYYVTLNAVTAANKTASVFKGVNTSPYRRAIINNVKIFQLPVSRTDGTAWDADGSHPDVYCKLRIGSSSGRTTTLNDVTTGQGLTINLGFFVSFNDSLFNDPLIIELYNENELPAEDDLMEVVTIDKNLTELMTTQLPYATTKAFQNNNVSGQLGFIWAP